MTPGRARAGLPQPPAQFIMQDSRDPHVPHGPWAALGREGLSVDPTANTESFF
jgi:hypothetical protein